jgi:hypothetical protein
MFESVNAFKAATAPDFALVPGLVTEQAGKVGSIKNAWFSHD